MPNLNLLTQFEREMWILEHTFFNVKKREEFLISTLLNVVGGWFLDILCNFRFSTIGLKTNYLWSFSSLSSPPPNLGTAEFWPKVIFTQKCRVRYQLQAHCTKFTEICLYRTEQMIFILGKKEINIWHKKWCQWFSRTRNGFFVHPLSPASTLLYVSSP